MTISAAGFGRRINWEDDEVPPGHTLGFKRSIQIVSTGLFTIRARYPQWIFEWAPTEKIREARDGFAEFRVSLLRCRLRTSALPLRTDLTRAVVFGRDDRRAEVL